ncbi:putative tRNA dimethylallyltransferase [Blattamonas nauphoetae]|uniref:tRNA dimethylallyltransferase n=1 Tax=Blattamonas nauphoetae TaxID=2049346 RepID=A0ABQ9Y1S9_9EUKA|nr:putative tRNA dimethylallyltransferase [Blattamonas nauphoetae]
MTTNDQLHPTLSPSKSKPQIICIIGSTGTGKSSFGIRLADAIHGEIINADAMQCYSGLPISTNKPSQSEMERVPHHLFSFLNPHQSSQQFTIVDYLDCVDKCISDILSRQKVPIIVGGTHYYIEHLLRRDLDSLHPHTEPTDRFTTYKKRKPLDISPSNSPSSPTRFPYDALLLWMDASQNIERLNQNLDIRIDEMEKRGLLLEVTSFYQDTQQFLRKKTIVNDGEKREKLDTPGKGEPLHHLTLETTREEDSNELSELPVNTTHGIYQAIGFKEFLPFLTNSAEFTECIASLKRTTRNYAKKQTKFITSRLLPQPPNAELSVNDSDTPWTVFSLNIFQEPEPLLTLGITIAHAFLSHSLPELADDVSSLVRYKPTPPPVMGPDGTTMRTHDVQFCEVCNKSIAGLTEWKQHLDSRSHRTCLSKQKRKEKKRAQSEAIKDREPDT